MTWDTFSQPKASSWTAMEMGQAYSAKLMQFGATNLNSALKFAGELSRVKSPTDFADTVTNETRRQFETLTEQFQELSSVFASGSSESKSKSDDEESAGLGD
jgi:hypothetical protein